MLTNLQGFDLHIAGGVYCKPMYRKIFIVDTYSLSDSTM